MPEICRFYGIVITINDGSAKLWLDLVSWTSPR
jgi:hypothetical protein